MASSAAKAERGQLRGERVPTNLEVAGSAPNLLAIHGFGGTPFEVELLLDVARERGIGAFAPLLPGHGTQAQRLAQTRFSDWSGAVDQALARTTEPVIVAGLSLGTLLALDVTLRNPQAVKALILLANAVWLRAPFPRWGLKLADRLNLPDFLAPKAGPDISDTELRRSHVSYNADPVHAAVDVLRAGERVRERLGEVRCPTLILHGAHDRVCPVSNAWRVAERLGSEDCRVVVLPRSRHILTRDVEHLAVRREISDFIARFAGAAIS
jgi:carboxylesterase